MRNLRDRLRAFRIHLVISLSVAALAAWLVFGIWYPYPYREISGGRELFLLVMSVDVVMGPLITLVVFNRAKTSLHLAMDFSVIGLLQLAALGYGLWAVFVARPVHLVFEYQRMAVVHAVDVDPGSLAQAPRELQALPVYGPTLLSLRPLKNADEQMNSTMLAMAGVVQAAQPALWQPYELSRNDILETAKPVSQLKARFPSQSDVINAAIGRSGHQAENLRFLPLRARNKAWTVLIDAETALPVGFLPIDSF